MTVLDPAVRDALHSGVVIPAHPLALDEHRRMSERHQRALTRYYLAAGAGGLAVGVHTTQFAIRDPKIGLFRPVLELAMEEIRAFETSSGRRIIRIAGICGRTDQAVAEAQLARELGYDIGLLSMSALRDADVPQLVAHARAVAEVMPVFGFYLQPSVGGRTLPIDFWRAFAALDGVVGIKIAPFNRYQTLDVLRGVAESGRAAEIALYTGNDDNIVLDLLSRFHVQVGGREVTLRIVGGLLGHWACWTRRAVEQLEDIRRLRDRDAIPAEWLTRALQVTDMNAAIFDAANGFAGCIAGVHEVLRRQGLMPTRYCLDPHEDLSPGQAEEITRVTAAYPHLVDDEFVNAHRERWLA